MKLLSCLEKKVCPKPLLSENCSVEQANNRVVAEDIFTLYDMPRYDESLRDGFAICGEGPYALLKHEAYAGNTEQVTLHSGEACTIMTGGLLPLGADKVVPKEWAQCDQQQLSHLSPPHAPNFIRKRGSHNKKGVLLIPKGQLLDVDHVALLANAGFATVPVVQKPKVALFATGNELKSVGVTLQAGQKTASNGLVLSHLVQDFGGNPSNCGVLEDTREALAAFLHTIEKHRYNIIVATGGMGPGRYDLMEECFVNAGGHVVTTSLPLLPGKSCLVGFLGETLFFGFPGTPSALRPLFTELVAPALLQMQGIEQTFPHSIEVPLSGPIHARQAEVPSLRGGRLLMDNGCLVVRSTGKQELSPTVYIIIPPHTSELKDGDMVWVHSVGRTFSL